MFEASQKFQVESVQKILANDKNQPIDLTYLLVNSCFKKCSFFLLSAQVFTVL
jgi:hypothetical protein